jgi:hypothetical protein
MPNFDNTITNRTVGDAFDIVRTVGGTWDDTQSIDDAYLTVMPNGGGSTPLFQKHITAVLDADEGIIGTETEWTITCSGVQSAGSNTLVVASLPVTIDAGVVLQFLGGAWATVTAKAYQGATSISVDALDFAIGDLDTASYKTCRLTFKIKKENSVLFEPDLNHAYDIQLTFTNSDPYTFEDGTMVLRPQRTVGV